MRRFLLAFILPALLFPSHAAAQDPRDVVREDVRAMSEGDGQALVNLFDERSRIYALPTRPDRIAGDLSPRIGTQSQRETVFLSPPPSPARAVEIVEMVAFGPLVAARLKAGADGDAEPPVLTLVLFRIEGPIITDLWHLTRTGASEIPAAVDPRAVVAALDGSDAVGLFADDAVFHETSDPRSAGDLRVEAPATGDRAARSLETAALGDLVVSRETGVDAAGQGVERLTVYRVTDGRISHRWRLASRPAA